MEMGRTDKTLDNQEFHKVVLQAVARHHLEQVLKYIGRILLFLKGQVTLESIIFLWKTIQCIGYHVFLAILCRK
jgi:hypothetical protein